METTPRELPDRLLCVTRYPRRGRAEGAMKPSPIGDYVRYSDYAALATRLAESEARAEDARDAARYRYLRPFWVWWQVTDGDGKYGDELDAAIDAAIAQEAGREAGSA